MTPRTTRSLILIPLVVLASACSGEASQTQSEAMCSDFKNDLTVMNLIGDREPQEFADLVYGNVAISCPEMLDDPVIASYLTAWGITRDAPTADPRPGGRADGRRHL